MSHLTSIPWHGYATDPRRVEITVASTLVFTDITSAQLRIHGQTAVALTPQTATGGYKLVANTVTLPATPNVYSWSAEVTDTAGNTPIRVAEGSLRVDARTTVA